MPTSRSTQASSASDGSARHKLRARLSALKERRMKKNTENAVSNKKSVKSCAKKRKTSASRADIDSWHGSTQALQLSAIQQELIKAMSDSGSMSDSSSRFTSEKDDVMMMANETVSSPQQVQIESAIVTTTGSRESNEDTHINLTEVPGGKFMAVFDGHGGKKISEMAEERVLDLLTPELESRLEMIENGTLEDAHLSVAEAFNQCTDKLHEEIKCAFLKGGSTALMIFLTPRCIFMHQMGDCRGTISKSDGMIKAANRAMVDGAFPENGVVDKGIGPAQTPIHAMPGDAVLRVDPHLTKNATIYCTMESMAQMRIENDDEDETAFHEWCAYNIAHCTSLINLQERCHSNSAKKIIHSSHPALLPQKDRYGNAWRLCPCETQPTRGLRGYNEKVLPNGQTWRYDISMEECAKEHLVLGFGCDGVEDNKAIPASKIMECITSFGAFQSQLDDDNLLQRNWNGFESYPIEGTFREKIQWMQDHSDKIKINDRFWKDSVGKSARILGEMLDDGSLDEAFMARDEVCQNHLDVRCKAFVELINLCASADNVTFGMTTFH